MSREADIPQDLKQLEASLRSLTPVAPQLERDRLMYSAGQAAAEAHSSLPPSRHSPPATRHSSWMWPTATAGMSTVAATLLVLLLARPEPAIVERIVYVPQPAASPDAANDRAPAQSERDEKPSPPQPTFNQNRPALTGGWLGLGTPARRPEYLDLRDQVLALGVDTWQRPSRGASSPTESTPYRQTLDSLLAPSNAPAIPATPQPSPADGAQL